MVGENRVFVSKKVVSRSKVLEQFLDGKLSREEASLGMNLSERQVSRLASRFREGGILGIEPPAHLFKL